MTVATESSIDDFARLFEDRDLQIPPGLVRAIEGQLLSRLGELVFRPASDPSKPDTGSTEWAEQIIESSPWPLLPNLVPILPVDELSFACVVASDRAGLRLPGEGAVVRWHLGVQHDWQQAAILDTDCDLYLESVAEEMVARGEGLKRVLDEIGPAYEEMFLARDERPRDFVLRPVRIACQNVIVGLAAFAQESSFDGLSVIAWQTCEVPHVAAHEANRALAVLTLCDAFQNGGTMEIRFDKPALPRIKGKKLIYTGHPEAAVPASLRRFARTVGVPIAKNDPASITPDEARGLFQAVTPMPDELRMRFSRAVNQLGIAPERLCYTLLKPVWKEIELDYLLATSLRVGSILRGGSDWRDRLARQSESEICRAAVMIGMLYRRLNATDAAGASGEARVIEDLTRGIEWSINDVDGAVTFAGLRTGERLPWTTSDGHLAASTLTVYPRSLVTRECLLHISNRARSEAVALIVPTGTVVPRMPDDLMVLYCPDRLANLDRNIEERLLTSRVSRG